MPGTGPRTFPGLPAGRGTQLPGPGRPPAPGAHMRPPAAHVTLPAVAGALVED